MFMKVYVLNTQQTQLITSAATVVKPALNSFIIIIIIFRWKSAWAREISFEVAPRLRICIWNIKYRKLNNCLLFNVVVNVNSNEFWVSFDCFSGN